MPQRAPIYSRILESWQNAVAKAEGYQREAALLGLRNWQFRWLKYLVAAEQFQQAADLIRALPRENHNTAPLPVWAKEAALAEPPVITPLELRVAAKLATLDSKLASYRADPQSAPSSEMLRQSARALLDAGDKQSARKVLEFVFRREIDEHHLVAANFLGLAEIRLASGDTSGALQLLRRLVVVVGTPFENLDAAASLLEKTGHPAEAIEFLENLTKSAPWELGYRLRLAKAKIAAGGEVKASEAAVATVASAVDAPYSLRVEAALTLASAHASVKLESGELDSLVHSAFSRNQPFSYDLRVRSAQAADDLRTRTDLLRAALADTPARDDARIALFDTAARQHADELARAALEPLLKQGILESSAVARNEQDELVAAEEEDPPGEDEPRHPADLSTPKLTEAQKARLAVSLAAVLIRLDQLKQALPYLNLARKLEKAPSRRREVNSTIADVRARLSRRQANLSRAPILHEALEQDRLVRPRLLLQAAAAAKTAPARKGERP